MKVVAFVPLKLNNERLPNKNTKRFDNGRPLLSYVLRALMGAHGIDQIFTYCSNDAVVEHLPVGVHFLRRSPELDHPQTRINEVMLAFARDVVADIYVLAHATAPFIARRHIEEGVLQVRSGRFDSALTVLKLQEFLWQDGRPLNYDPASIPRTQDLAPLHAETTGLYVYQRKLIVDQQRRVGIKPYLIEVSKIEAIDINELVDFEIANAVAMTLDAELTGSVIDGEGHPA
jgi:CMP-N-acetylneuraminic acid synthetase